MPDVDVAIVGAGIFGLSAAWACQKRGMSVRVFEARNIGSGASGGLVGALSPHMPEKWNPKKAFQLEALLAAPGFWKRIETASGLPSGFRRNGRILPLRSERLRNQALVRAQEVPLLWKGEASWNIIDSFNGVAASSHGFVRETLSAQLRPRAALAAFAMAFRKSGGEIRENSPVASVEEIRAGQVIVAAGHDSRALSGEMPKEFWSGVKGQSAIIDVQLPDDMPMVFESGVYVVPHGSFGVAVGSTVEREWSTPHRVDERLDDVITEASALVPALKGALVKETWAGVRPRARLPDPVIGRLKNDAWLLAGGFKIGLGLGPYMGETLAALINGEDPVIPPSFRLETQLERCD